MKAAEQKNGATLQQRGATWRGRPWWAIAGLAAIALLALVFYTWSLSRNGMANSYYAAAVGSLACWFAVAGWHVYQLLRQWISGLDQIAWGALFFVVALLISLAKAGLPQRVWDRWARRGS